MTGSLARPVASAALGSAALGSALFGSAERDPNRPTALARTSRALDTRRRSYRPRPRLRPEGFTADALPYRRSNA
jgi:hypothetical protein